MQLNLTGYRKTLVAVSCLVISGSFLISGHLSAIDFVELNKFVLPSFFAANLAEYIMNHKPKKGPEVN